MKSVFQLLRKKEEALPADTLKVLSFRQRRKKLTWAGQNPVLPRYVKQKCDERSPTPP